MDQLTSAEVPAPAIGLLKSMLAVDPAARPQSARELLAAVDRCAKGERDEPARAEAEVRREEGFWVAVLPFKFSGTNCGDCGVRRRANRGNSYRLIAFSLPSGDCPKFDRALSHRIMCAGSVTS